MRQDLCPHGCGRLVSFTMRGKVHGAHKCPAAPVPPKPAAPDGMAWCGVCELAVTVLEDGRLNGHGVHGHACAGSWAPVVPAEERES